MPITNISVGGYPPKHTHALQDQFGCAGVLSPAGEFCLEAGLLSSCIYTDSEATHEEKNQVRDSLNELAAPEAPVPLRFYPEGPAATYHTLAPREISARGTAQGPSTYALTLYTGLKSIALVWGHPSFRLHCVSCILHPWPLVH